MSTYIPANGKLHCRICEQQLEHRPAKDEAGKPVKEYYCANLLCQLFLKSVVRTVPAK